MSDVEEDLEFYAALEDELYKETRSLDSDDEIDSELEAELYQSVHFASSFVVTPSKSEQEKTDAVEESDSSEALVDEKQLDSPGNSYTDSPIEEADDESIYFVDRDEEHGICKYPEVKLVFSDENKTTPKTSGSKRDTASHQELNTAKTPDHGGNNQRDNWILHEADLVPKISNNIGKKRKAISYVRCFNCNERGHRTFDCTQPKKEKVCSLCGKVGHLKQECPNDLCYNCREPGHQLRQCRKPRCRPGDTCRRCHAYGHFESMCPDRWRQYHLTIKQGNIIPSKSQANPRKGNIFCYNCGEQGHLGHECLEVRPNGSFDVPLPFVVKYDRVTSCSPREDSKKNHYHGHVNDHNQQQQRKSKHGKSEYLHYDGERRKKKRKMEDDWEYRDQQGDQNWNYSRDNWDMMEQHPGRRVFWGNNDFVDSSQPPDNGEARIDPKRGKKKRKKKKKAKIEGNNMQVIVTEDGDKNRSDKNKNRKRKRKMNGLLSPWNMATNTKKNKKMKKVNEQQLNPDRHFHHWPVFETEFSRSSAKAKPHRNQERSFMQPYSHEKNKPNKSKKSKKRPAKTNESRTVHFNFNGFV